MPRDYDKNPPTEKEIKEKFTNYVSPTENPGSFSLPEIILLIITLLCGFGIIFEVIVPFLFKWISGQ